MSTVSRQYLQELPEMKRREREEKEFKEKLDRLFQMIHNPLMAAAELGETKYLFDMKPWGAWVAAARAPEISAATSNRDESTQTAGSE
jgi:hypothetical protein